jgi:hypothetical protein
MKRLRKIPLADALRLLERTAMLAHTSWGTVNLYWADLARISEVILKVLPTAKDIIDPLQEDELTDCALQEIIEASEAFEDCEKSDIIVHVPPLMSEGWVNRHQVALRTIAMNPGEKKEREQGKRSGLGRQKWSRAYRELKSWNLVESFNKLTPSGTWLADVRGIGSPARDINYSEDDT